MGSPALGRGASMPGTILIVDNEAPIAESVRESLEKNGFLVRLISNLASAQIELQKSLPDLVILDRVLPDGDGIEICRFLRTQPESEHIPILFVSGKKDIVERVISLRMGGDDYLSKPFDMTELVARVEALLRRALRSGAAPAILQCGEIVIDSLNHECRIENEVIELRPKEFELLILFLQSKKRLLTKEFISEQIWEAPHFSSSRAIDTAIQRLRNKLGDYADCVETVRGYGFRFNEDHALRKSA